MAIDRGRGQIRGGEMMPEAEHDLVRAWAALLKQSPQRGIHVEARADAERSGQVQRKVLEVVLVAANGVRGFVLKPTRRAASSRLLRVFGPSPSR